MREQLGLTDKGWTVSYDNFVDLSSQIMKGRTSDQQREVVAKILSSLLPPEASDRFRKWFPFNKVSITLHFKRIA